jgi:hypothetical protein
MVDWANERCVSICWCEVERPSMRVVAAGKGTAGSEELVSDGQEGVAATVVGIHAVVAEPPFPFVAIVARPETSICECATVVAEMALL